MEKKRISPYAIVCLALFLLFAPNVSAQWDDGMEVLNYYFEIESSPPRDQWYPWVEHNPIENEFMAIWRTSGPLREDCEPGDAVECTNDFQSMDGRRISPDGELLGDPIQLSPPEQTVKNGARFAYNIFTNEYLTASPIGARSDPTELYIARIDSVGTIQSGPQSLYEGGGGESFLPIVVFNSQRREYLVVYNDRNIYNAYNNNVGFILDENGTPIEGPFEVGNQEGDMYASRGVYNPTNDTYLVVWEDFRNVADWLEHCDMYGVLLDSDGNMIVEIPIMDDSGMPDEGDQRVPVPAYNPDRNEFLVVWKVALKPSQPDAGAIVGRFINADGTLSGEHFVVDDHPRIQHWPDIRYIQEQQKYFMVWNDTRNDGLSPGDPWYQSNAMNVYARWLDPSGTPTGDEILIAEADYWQMVPIIAYNPVMKRFLIAWYDRHSAGGDTPFAGASSDVSGTVYGAPSFLSGRVIEEGTGEPVEDARVIVIGLGVLTMETANIGGWWNIPENAQRQGRYFIIAQKNGYRMAMKSVTYEGAPVQTTIELK
jgi:hypothetical protein